MPSNNNWLDPLIVVVCLLAVQLVLGQRLTIGVQSLALLAFMVSAPLLYRSDRNQLRPGEVALPAACSRVLMRWGTIVIVLLFFGYAFPLLMHFSSAVILTWIVVTAVALCLSQAARLRT